jgi:hypothetical protein
MKIRAFDEDDDTAKHSQSRHGTVVINVELEACILMGGPERWLITFPDMWEPRGDGGWQERPCWLPARELEIVARGEGGWVLLRMPAWLFERRAEYRADRLRDAELERNRLAERARQARRQHENQVARARPVVQAENQGSLDLALPGGAPRR